MFHYYASMMEPWDGPAAILFSDGEQVGAVLDRNSLRPARYLVTNDGYLILASKVGALPIPPERIVRKSRLQPGKMLLVDTRTGTVLEDREFKHRYAAEHPLCEMCLKEGRLTPVEEVHHILPISQGGDHRQSNLMSLCQSCHTKLHRELGDR